MDTIISHIVLMEQQRTTIEVNGLIKVNEIVRETYECEHGLMFHLRRESLWYSTFKIL